MTDKLNVAPEILTEFYTIDGQKVTPSAEQCELFSNLLFQGEIANCKFTSSQIKSDFIIVIDAASRNDISLKQFNCTAKTINSYQILDINDEPINIEAILLSHTNSIKTNNFPVGYYYLILDTDEQNYRIFIIAKPTSCYQPKLIEQHGKIWGINVQLYSLKSESNWGIGDFNDLLELVELASKQGADFIGVNPLHLLYLNQPESASPYSPCSRSWLNPLYISLLKVPEFMASSLCQTWFKSSKIQQQIADLRASKTVDYTTVTQLKLQALEYAFLYFKTKTQTNRYDLFTQFVIQQDVSLQLQAIYNVISNKLQLYTNKQDEGWLDWPAEFNNIESNEIHALVKLYNTDIEFYTWLQWLAYTQLHEVQALCSQANMLLGLYGDLAVGVKAGSADVWIDNVVYCLDATIGAPPDPLGPVGQNWGLSPMNPRVLRQQAYKSFINILRANMRLYGALRIDHVMGLARLWWIPAEKEAKDGIYIQYCLDEMFAIVAVESYLHKCLVIGEDLGTVPIEVRQKLEELNIFSYKVFFFEKDDQQYTDSVNYPEKSIAVVATHDLPTLSGFWECLDIKLLQQLNIITDTNSLNNMYDCRLQDKQKILDILFAHQYLAETYEHNANFMAMHDQLNLAIHQFVASSSSQMFALQLEDLLNMQEPVNIPSTNMQYPNWRRKLTLTTQEIFNNPYILEFIQNINRSRKNKR